MMWWCCCRHIHPHTSCIHARGTHVSLRFNGMNWQTWFHSQLHMHKHTDTSAHQTACLRPCSTNRESMTQYTNAVWNRNEVMGEKETAKAATTATVHRFTGIQTGLFVNVCVCVWRSENVLFACMPCIHTAMDECMCVDVYNWLLFFITV